MTVRAGRRYLYEPVPMDRCDPPVGIRNGTLAPGQIVEAVNLPGCPKVGTMGHAHIRDPDSKQFLGLVAVGSLKYC